MFVVLTEGQRVCTARKQNCMKLINLNLTWREKFLRDHRRKEVICIRWIEQFDLHLALHWINKAKIKRWTIKWGNNIPQSLYSTPKQWFESRNVCLVTFAMSSIEENSPPAGLAQPHSAGSRGTLLRYPTGIFRLTLRKGSVYCHFFFIKDGLLWICRRMPNDSKSLDNWS